MLNNVNAQRVLSPDEIIHIGDNPKADIEGARNVGISSLLVNSNGHSITKLVTHAAQNVFTI